MIRLPKEFVWRTARALLFIGLVILVCAGVSSAGLFLATRYGLTKSREQIPLAALTIEGEGSIELPLRGRMVEGDGWRLRNSRDIYTLTLDNAVIGDRTEGTTGQGGLGAGLGGLGAGQGGQEAGEEGPGAGQGGQEAGKEKESPPAVSISGDLIIELKDGSGNWIRSDGNGIQIEAGTLVIRGTGSLTLDAGGAAIAGGGIKEPYPVCRIEGGELEVNGYDYGIFGVELELAGGNGAIEAESGQGIGICVSRYGVEPSLGSFTVRGNAGAVLEAAPKALPGNADPGEAHVGEQEITLTGK